MRRIGLFYGSSSGNTESVAIRIMQQLGKERVSIYDVSSSPVAGLLLHDFIFMGIPTWGIGELQVDWEDFLLQLNDVDLSGKTIALFGLGDQDSYPDTFSDAL